MKAGFARLLEPPRLRTRGRGLDEMRRATWLELFFDLVFVAAVGQLANVLAAEPTTARFFEFLGLFLPLSVHILHGYVDPGASFSGAA